MKLFTSDISTYISSGKRFAEDELVHMSTKSWSDYTSSDYTVEQWHGACLIHHHAGPPTSKDQCKLPIKTPDGAVNKNAIFSAAAALAGARTPINATSEEKASAARILIRYYREMDKPPPESLSRIAGVTIVLEKSK